MEWKETMCISLEGIWQCSICSDPMHQTKLEDKNEENEWNNSAKIIKSSTMTSENSETTFGSSASERRSLANVVARQQEVFDEEEEPLHARTQCLQDIYNTINEIHVVCLLADSEDVSFEEAVVNEK